MKVVIVIETKDKVIDLGNNNVKLEIGKEIEIISAKPLPSKMDQGYPCEKYDEGYSDGWDACIDEILGE